MCRSDWFRIEVRSCWLIGALVAAHACGCASLSRPTQKGEPLKTIVSRLPDEQLRAELLAFSDTASTRVNQLCDQIVRDADAKLALVRSGPASPEDLDLALARNIRIRSRANVERLSVVNLCLTNASNPKPMTGFLDATFAFTIKARGADRRLERLNSVATTRDGSYQDDPLDPWAREFVVVYKYCNDDLWTIAEKALAPEEVNGLSYLIEDYLADNPDLRYATAKAVDLQRYVGRDADRSRAFSLVDLKSTNEQVDRAMWMAVRMPDLLRLEAKQSIFDAAKEAGMLRDDMMMKIDAAIDRAAVRISDERRKAIDQAAVTISEERVKAIEHASASLQQSANDVSDRLIRRALLWIVLPVAGIAFISLRMILATIRRSTGKVGSQDSSG